MTATEIVRARIVQVPAVVALVGSRVYSLMLPQSFTSPAIRVQQIGTEEETHLRGGSGLYRARVQTDAVAHATSGVDAYAAVRTLMEALHGDHDGAALCGFRGAVAGVVVESVRHGMVREDFSGPELGEVRIFCDWLVTWREA